MTAHRPLEEADILLIERVRDTPSLYDPRNGDFRLQPRKEEDWVKVAKSLNITVSDARRRWTCLRDRYSRELKQLRMHPNGGQYGKNKFFEQMDFLREFVRKRRERTRRPDDRSSSSWCKVESLEVKTDAGDIDSLVEDDGDETHTMYDSSEHNYDEKLEVHTQPEAYAMLVEEDGEEQFEEYTVQPNSDSKHISMSPMMAATSTSPCLVAPPQLSEGHSYTICKSAAAVAGCAKRFLTPPELHLRPSTNVALASDASSIECENEDIYFCKSIAGYLRQLNRRHKIKAKVEIYQILEKYIEIEERVADRRDLGTS